MSEIVSEKAVPLFEANDARPVAYFCGECRCAVVTREAALRCCRCPTCGVGKPTGRGLCEPCLLGEQQRMVIERSEVEDRTFEKANKVSADDYLAPVFDLGGVFHQSVADYLDTCDPGERDGWVWGTRPLRLSLVADDIVNCALENDEHFEEAWAEIDDLEGLQKLLDTWCEKQTMASHFEDRTVAIPIKLARERAA